MKQRYPFASPKNLVYTRRRHVKIYLTLSSYANALLDSPEQTVKSNLSRVTLHPARTASATIKEQVSRVFATQGSQESPATRKPTSVYRILVGVKELARTNSTSSFATVKTDG